MGKAPTDTRLCGKLELEVGKHYYQALDARNDQFNGEPGKVSFGFNVTNTRDEAEG